MKKKIYLSYLRLVLIVGMIIYLIIPTRISFRLELFYLQIIIYTISIFCFFKIQNKKNYFDVDTIIITFLTIGHFVIPFYTNSEELSHLFFRGYTPEFFIRGVGIATLGVISYMLGSINAVKKNKNVRQNVNHQFVKSINSNLIIILIIVCILIFYKAGGYNFYISQYREGVGIDTGNNLIFQTISLITVFSNLFCADIYLKQKISFSTYICLCIILIFALSVAFVGCRTLFADIVLPYIMCYTYLVKPQNLTKTIIYIIIGVSCMYILQITRQGGDTFNTGFFYLFSDMIIPGNVYFESMGYVEKYGLNYGITMLPPLIGCVPGLSSFLGEWTTTGSAEIMTRYLLGPYDVGGLGTTLLTDIYISFGIIGVPLFMYCLGFYANKKWKSKDVDMLVKIAIFSSCLFMCRSNYFRPLRLIIWSILYYKLIYLFKSRINK